MKALAPCLVILLTLAPLTARAEETKEVSSAPTSQAPSQDAEPARQEQAAVQEPAASSTQPASTNQQSYLRKATPSTEKAAPSPTERSDPSFGRVLAALLLLALLGAFAIYAKRRKGGGSALLRDHVRLHTIGSVQLGPKSQVALLSVGREAILVGVSEQGITCLRNFREEELGSLTTRNAPSPSETESIEMEAEDAFNDLLVRAAQTAPLRSEAKQGAVATPMRRAFSSPAPAQPLRSASGASASASSGSVATTLDEFTPSGFRDDFDDHEELEEQIPPHLVDMLAHASLQTTQGQTRPSNVKPLRPHQLHPQSHFAEPEGQAAELMRRFAELGK